MTDYRQGWLDGAAAMREAIAKHLELLGPVSVGMSVRFNAEGWRRMVLDARHYPTTPPPPPEPSP